MSNASVSAHTAVTTTSRIRYKQPKCYEEHTNCSHRSERSCTLHARIACVQHVTTATRVAMLLPAHVQRRSEMPQMALPAIGTANMAFLSLTKEQKHEKEACSSHLVGRLPLPNVLRAAALGIFLLHGQSDLPLSATTAPMWSMRPSFF